MSKSCKNLSLSIWWIVHLQLLPVKTKDILTSLGVESKGIVHLTFNCSGEGEMLLMDTICLR